MKTADFNNRIIDGYLKLLKNLDPSSKLDLISKLTKSIKSDLKDRKNAFEKAFGAWDNSENADTINKEIRNSRSFNRKIEGL
nr:hypothetical protein [Saprospiraceae bacterium]